MADTSANSDTLQALPLFPLGAAVFPGTLLPLRIFELRYLQMVGECERLNKPFGVVTLTQGSEVHRPGTPAERFEPIGTLMRLEKIERPHPGLLHIGCRAVDTFEVLGQSQRGDGLWLGEVRVLAPEPRTLSVARPGVWTAPFVEAALVALDVRGVDSLLAWDVATTRAALAMLMNEVSSWAPAQCCMEQPSQLSLR